MKIKYKLILGFASFVLLMVIVGADVAMHSINIKTDIKAIVSNNLGEVEGATKIAFNIQKTESNMRELFLESVEKQLGASEKEIIRAKEAIIKALSDIQKYSLSWKNAIEVTIEPEDDDELKTFEDMNLKLDKFVALSNELLGIYEEEGYETAKDFFEYAVEPLSRELQSIVAGLEEETKEEIIATAQDIEALATNSASTSIILTATGLLVTITFGLFFSKYISRSITGLCAAAIEIGNGNLDTRIKMSSNDEIAELAHAFNKMVDDLKNTTTSIDDLNAVNQQLHASQHQLQANEQQLRATNQQLQAEVMERKHVEKNLRESERKTRASLENSPVCTKIVDLDFNLQYISHSGLKSLNIDDASELYGKPYPFEFYSFQIQYLLK